MEKILIIDDELESLEIHKAYLENDYDVVTFHSSLDALEQVANIKPDLILLDIEMPFLNGFEMLERIRDMKECANVPIIGLTGQKSKASVLNFLGKGGSGYITKPVPKNVLLSKVHETIEQEKQKQEKKKILIIDDELESLYLFKTFLQEFYNVTTLNSSKIGIEYLQKFVPDLIILDYQMPLFNGKAMYQIIKKMERLQDVPIIFLTGEQDKEILLEVATLLPDGVVLKTAGKDALLEKVRAALEK